MKGKLSFKPCMKISWLCSVIDSAWAGFPVMSHDRFHIQFDELDRTQLHFWQDGLIKERKRIMSHAVNVRRGAHKLGILPNVQSLAWASMNKAEGQQVHTFRKHRINGTKKKKFNLTEHHLKHIDIKLTCPIQKKLAL